MVGIFTMAENYRRLTSVEHALERGDLHDDEREDLEVLRDELRVWIADVWRAEGGGVTVP